MTIAILQLIVAMCTIQGTESQAHTVIRLQRDCQRTIITCVKNAKGNDAVENCLVKE